MKLIAILDKNPKAQGQIAALINHGEWDEIILVKENSTPKIIKNSKYVISDFSKDIISLKADFLEKLKSYLKDDFEVSLSLAAGSGKEHMALISALLSIPVGVKIVAYTKKGVISIN